MLLDKLTIRTIPMTIIRTWIGFFFKILTVIPMGAIIG